MARTAKVKESYSDSWSEKGEYTVRLADGMFDEDNPALAEALREATGEENPRVMLVADSNVVHRTAGLGMSIGKYVKAHGITLAGSPVVMGGGEKLKADDLQSAMKIVAAALEAKIGANGAMMVIGGGSLLDTAGFAAKHVRGGTRLVRVPTTVAAMADAAFADRAALDFCGIKDAISVPCRPDAVVVDTAFASTILDGVSRGGVGELVRHALVNNGSLMEKIASLAGPLHDRDPEAVREVIRECIASRMKNGTTGFALWSALRLEAMSLFKLPHGYAVPLGICIDCEYAAERGLMSREDCEMVRGTLAAVGALDCMDHSRHLFSRCEDVLRGLDAWALYSGKRTVVLPSKVGKFCEDEPDRELYAKVVEGFAPGPHAR